MAVQWTQILSVGIAPKNGEHSELLFRVNELLEARSHGIGKDEIGGAIQSLADYVASRFGSSSEGPHRYEWSEATYRGDEAIAFLENKPEPAHEIDTHETAPELVLGFHVGYVIASPTQ